MNMGRIQIMKLPYGRRDTSLVLTAPISLLRTDETYREIIGMASAIRADSHPSERQPERQRTSKSATPQRGIQ